VLKLKLMAKTIGDRLQDENGLLRNFRPDAVARENREVQKHGDDWVIGKFSNWVIENLVILSCGRDDGAGRVWFFRLLNYKIPQLLIPYTPQR
jgi:hypothetical protein